MTEKTKCPEQFCILIFQGFPTFLKQFNSRQGKSNLSDPDEEKAAMTGHVFQSAI